MSQLLYLIPARKGSKRIPNKNLLPIKGKPLIQYSIETALASKFSNKRILVTTDSEEIGALAKNLGAEFLKRPMEIAGDKSPDIEFVRHALEVLKKQDYSPDYIVHLRPTTPFRNIQIVDAIIQKLLDSDADAIRSLEKVKHLPEKCVFVNHEGLLEDYFGQQLRNVNKPSEHFKEAVTANGYVDVFRNLDFTNKEDIYQNLRVLPYLFEPDQILDLDEFKDLQRFGIQVQA